MKFLGPLSLIALFSGCTDPGWVRGPIGRDPLLTGVYRIGVGENRPELLLFLSTSAYDGCTLPNFEDEALQARVGERALLATCREGAQHLMVKAHAADARWTGSFPVDAGLSPRDVGINGTRVASARYYGVREAFRLRLTEFLDSYAASSSENLEPVPGVGELQLEHRDGILRGAFVMEGLVGEFVATECPGDTSLLETLDESWMPAFCEISI